MARPFTEDWLLYEAVTECLARKILGDEEICRRSFSILRFKEISAKRTDAWLKFDEQSRTFYENGYKYAVVSDITGYYENISLGELQNRVTNYLGGDTCEERLLFSLLKRWSNERIRGYGLPQGPLASSFLADIFLDHVDRKMETYKGYFRYMDDIRIFCKRKIEAKIALKDLVIALRGIKLNINAKKTDIMANEEIEQRLFDPLKPLLNIVEMIMNSKDKKRIQDIIPGLSKVFEDSFSSDPFEKTHLNFALYRLLILHASGFEFDMERVIRNIEQNFLTKPHHAGLFCSFLSMFPNNKEIAKFLLSFLRSENNIYEWQELKVLQTLLRFNIEMNRSDIDFFIRSAKDLNNHYAVRSFYFLLAGKYGGARDRDLIVDSYKSSFESYTKMAVILSVQELAKSQRNSFYSQIERYGNGDEIKQFVNYVKSLQEPVYYLAAARPRIETYEEFEGASYESV